MDKLTKGTWIINSSKHLNDIKANSYELDFLNKTLVSGKCGVLLSKLMANNQEVIDSGKLNVFARESYITPEAVSVYLNYLKKQGKVDFSKDTLDNPKEIEIYCFSNEDAIRTVSDIYEATERKETEDVSLSMLEMTYEVPRTENEVIETLAQKKYSEENIKLALELHEIFGLTKNNKNLIYNEYTFTGNDEVIEKAFENFSSKDKRNVEDVLSIISNNQGYLYDKLKLEFDESTIRMMEGIGIIEGIEVESPIGKATFLTTPHLKGNGVGKFTLSADVFHKAKILLSCLKFGQEKSTYGRGKISTEEKMLNIIRKLNRGEWLKPCTAVGEDYKLLEIDGVVQIIPAKNNMYQMRLRQKEVGILVEQMIVYNKVNSFISNEDILLDGVNVSRCMALEQRRQKIVAQDTEKIKQLKENIFVTLRT